jgi:TetR/AcrR family transcriptional regulator, cholesterol catabolism regulator
MTKIRNRQQLIDVASRVFRERGYDAARLEDIAAELDMLQGSLYYHVGSKAGLLRLVLRNRFNSITEQIEEIAAREEKAEGKLRAAMEVQLHYVERHLPEMPQWFDTAADPKVTKKELIEDRAMLERYRVAWISILRDGIDAGVIKDSVDPSIAVLSILGMCNYVARWREWDDKHTLEQIASLQFDMLWAGLSNPRRRARKATTA